MNELRMTRIERYLLDEMSPQERQDFETELRESPEMKEEWEAYQLSLYAIRRERHAQWKQHFAKLDAGLHETPPKWYQNKNIIWPLISIGAVALLYLIFSIVKPTPDPVTPEEANQLFAAHFKLHLDETINPLTRGGEKDSSTLTSFYSAYWQGQISDASELYHLLLPDQQKDVSNRFFYANLLMAQDSIAKARNILETLHRSSSPYALEIQWYLALTLLREGNAEGAKTYLRDIAGSKRHPLHQNAIGLLQEMEN